jgi:hypothetical protein
MGLLLWCNNGSYRCLWEQSAQGTMWTSEGLSKGVIRYITLWGTSRNLNQYNIKALGRMAGELGVDFLREGRSSCWMHPTWYLMGADGQFPQGRVPDLTLNTRLHQVRKVEKDLSCTSTYILVYITFLLEAESTRGWKHYFNWKIQWSHCEQNSRSSGL